MNTPLSEQCKMVLRTSYIEHLDTSRSKAMTLCVTVSVVYTIYLYFNCPSQFKFSIGDRNCTSDGLF